MFAGLQARLIGLLVGILAVLGAVAAAFLKGKQAATTEIKQESTDQLLKDVAEKREIRDEVIQDIIASDRNERIDSL